MHSDSDSEWEWIEKWCNDRKNNDDNNEQMNSKLLMSKTESVTKSKSEAKIITRKWCVLFAHVLTRKKSINEK